MEVRRRASHVFQAEVTSDKAGETAARSLQARIEVPVQVRNEPDSHSQPKAVLKLCTKISAAARSSRWRLSRLWRFRTTVKFGSSDDPVNGFLPGRQRRRPPDIHQTVFFCQQQFLRLMKIQRRVRQMTTKMATKKKNTILSGYVSD